MAMNAVMATEDRDFYSHWGLNILAIPKAVLQSVSKGDKNPRSFHPDTAAFQAPLPDAGAQNFPKDQGSDDRGSH